MVSSDSPLVLLIKPLLQFLTHAIHESPYLA